MGPYNTTHTQHTQTTHTHNTHTHTHTHTPHTHTHIHTHTHTHTQHTHTHTHTHTHNTTQGGAFIPTPHPLGNQVSLIFAKRGDIEYTTELNRNKEYKENVVFRKPKQIFFYVFCSTYLQSL